ncbi:LacI family DNA-binding transcriptional regulator [Neobacillus niacini]|uniref:LacI family DNA-binding transcriptional regulator n=1 Tax=Neobacillus niacini TaxID=86668 RepID=UPI00398361C9
MNKSKVTIRDVAKEAGVSVATVSRYLNQNSYMSAETEKKIQEVMSRLEYKPNEIARGLAKKKSNTIALIIPDMTNPFFPDLVRAIEKVAKAKGYSLLLINSDEAELQDEEFWENFKRRYIDGFILASFEVDENFLAILEGLNIPFVGVDRAVKLDSENIVWIDNYEGAKIATEHLIQIGCKKIAHISGPHSFLPSFERKVGYLDTLACKCPEQDPVILEGDFSLESGKALTEKLLKENGDVDGIFLANDLMAIGSLKSMKLLNKEVPKDIAIIGFDGIKLTEFVEPALSTIEQPTYNIGAAVTTKLINMIEKVEDETMEYDLRVKLVQRESTVGFRGNQQI